MEEVRQRLQLALGAAHMAIWDATVRDGDIRNSTVSWSADGAAMLGLGRYPVEQSFSEFIAFVHPDDREMMLGKVAYLVEGCHEYSLEYRVIRADGAVRWLAARARTICEAGIPVRMLGIIWDDSERKQQEIELFEQKELAEVTLGAIGDAVITTDSEGKVRFLNRVAEQLTGWSNSEAQGIGIERIVRLAREATNDAIDNPVYKSLQQHHAVAMPGRAQLIARDAHRIAVEDSSAPIRSRDGTVVGAVMVFRDVSHERNLAHQVSWQAAHDVLTDLINRREFELAVAGALASAKAEGHRHALLYIDLDRFTLVNDSAGHGAGDMLLQLIARMLQQHMRESDVLARVGGDEFGVLLTYCPLPRALALADGIRQAIKDFHFAWNERTFEMSASIGLVEIGEDSKSVTELLVAANQACYGAREEGRNRVHLYSESDLMLARRQGELQWVSRLHEAFALDRFRLFGQPIVALSDGAGVTRDRDGFGAHEEVLVRIASAREGLILPAAFMPAAERYNLMAQLDRWVIRHVCRHISAERAARQLERAHGAEPPAPEVYSINLSGVSLGGDGMLAHIIGQFAEFHIDPRQICFEITETVIVANLPKAQEFIARLRTLGCRFALDDFGSGLSSFAYLRSLPVDYLKIDGLFIRGIAGDPVNRAMVKAINEVGHVMGIQTVAEYVEDAQTLDIVRELGIDYAQGSAVGELRALTGA
jgi:diguanylate cyclase (GGDEF)-like protein/PAS domain S-box-containing protein